VGRSDVGDAPSADWCSGADLVAPGATERQPAAPNAKALVRGWGANMIFKSKINIGRTVQGAMINWVKINTDQDPLETILDHPKITIRSRS
jgi:hypothetical protein